MCHDYNSVRVKLLSLVYVSIIMSWVSLAVVVFILHNLILSGWKDNHQRHHIDGRFRDFDPRFVGDKSYLFCNRGTFALLFSCEAVQDASFRMYPFILYTH